jgi:hypothetical protein
VLQSLLAPEEADDTAFQTGEALELLTGGKLAATPHFVSGSAGSTGSGEQVSRETFAFFLQYVSCTCSPMSTDVTGRTLTIHWDRMARRLASLRNESSLGIMRLLRKRLRPYSRQASMQCIFWSDDTRLFTTLLFARLRRLSFARSPR